MSKNSSYDLVILGSGSTAFAAALRAAELGKTAAMTEMRTLGGTLVNQFCIPMEYPNFVLLIHDGLVFLIAIRVNHILLLRNQLSEIEFHLCRLETFITRVSGFPHNARRFN